GKLSSAAPGLASSRLRFGNAGWCPDNIDFSLPPFDKPVGDTMTSCDRSTEHGRSTSIDKPMTNDTPTSSDKTTVVDRSNTMTAHDRSTTVRGKLNSWTGRDTSTARGKMTGSYRSTGGTSKSTEIGRTMSWAPCKRVQVCTEWERAWAVDSSQWRT